MKPILARRLLAAGLLATAAATPALAQQTPMTLGEKEYFESPGVNVLVFSNWYDGLFADSKISGVEVIQHDKRIATN